MLCHFNAKFAKVLLCGRFCKNAKFAKPWQQIKVSNQFKLCELCGFSTDSKRIYYEIFADSVLNHINHIKHRKHRKHKALRTLLFSTASKHHLFYNLCGLCVKTHLLYNLCALCVKKICASLISFQT